MKKMKKLKDIPYYVTNDSEVDVLTGRYLYNDLKEAIEDAKGYTRDVVIELRPVAIHKSPGRPKKWKRDEL